MDYTAKLAHQEEKKKKRKANTYYGFSQIMTLWFGMHDEYAVKKKLYDFVVTNDELNLI